MGTVPCREVVDSAGLLLQDSKHVRWTAAELMKWLNAGQAEAVIYKPNICVRSIDKVQDKGTKQDLPADGLSLIDIPRNSDGNVITVIPRSSLDAQEPGWHLPKNASATALHYCYSELDPKHYYIYPPSPGGSKVELIYNAIPTSVRIDDPIAIDDIYVSALVDYVIYRAFSKDSEFAPLSGASAAQHYTNFQNAIRGKAGSEAATDPNKRDISNPNSK
jgi:hypothetical protein